MARILVIDDDRSLRNMIRRTLASAGHEIEVAQDGAEGLGLFGDGVSWNLTLVDQRMPGLEGIDVIWRARERDPAARIVMMTAFDTVQLAAEALATGASDFLRKPFSAEMLRGAVSAALNRPRTAASESGAGEEHEIAAAESGAPAVRHFINGYFFWPAESTAADEEGPRAEVERVFQVQGPGGEIGRTTVGVMPHVQEQMRAGADRAISPDDALWTTVCQMAMMDCLWERAEMPPAFLPLFALSNQHLETIRRQTGFRPTPAY